MKVLIDKLRQENNLKSNEFLFLLNNMTFEDREYLISLAQDLCAQHYERRVFMRGLIELTSYCKQNCNYCGLRSSNKNAQRYRLEINEIIDVCESGYKLGFRTFVLQGGEDNYFDDSKIIEVVTKIKEKFPDCAVTLSIGEKSIDSYRKYFVAGADRYLLRHETASRTLYEKLHPQMSFDNRIKCLFDLKNIGYQVGAGFMVGLPGQRNEDLVEDLIFLKDLEPHMVGIGPFIPHKDTPLGQEKAGTVELTLTMIALVRLMLPQALMPSTTALGTIDPKGREKGLLAGANVVMPNLTPEYVRSKYNLYDDKICVNDSAIKCRACIEKKINLVGFSVDMSKGDHIGRSIENDNK